MAAELLIHPSKHRASTTVIKVLHAYLDLNDLDGDALLEKRGWTYEQINQPLGLLPLDEVLGFVQDCKDEADDPLFVMRAATWAPLGSYHILDYISTSAPTLGIALTRAFELLRMIDDHIAFEVEDGGDEVLAILSSKTDEPISSAEAEGILAGYAARANMCVASGRGLERVMFRHDVGDHSEDISLIMEADFAPNCEHYALLFTREQWEAENIHADPLMFNFLDQIAFKIAGPSVSLVRKVEQTIEQGLRINRFDLGFVARSLRLSRRTLQRRLCESDTSFQEILDKIRLRQAKRLLMNEALSIKEVGALLGLGHPSSITRAFRHWFGKTPRQLRSELLASAIEAEAEAETVDGDA